MDEWTAVGSWLAARRGTGYVALATEGGARLVRAGGTAFQEFRAAGRGTAWVCVVGDAARDGTFAAFVAALGDPEFGADSVAYRTRHGVALALDWTEPFLVDGRPADLGADGLPVEALHLDNPLVRLPFGAAELVIGEDGHRHVIDLRHGRPVD
ncbi:hypothetical protein [Actinokineospora sp.]|uniref:hypothetical protein n=1 Tax=Actinokineospora sp. TaxID=1872133 RepID=UPI004037904E